MQLANKEFRTSLINFLIFAAFKQKKKQKPQISKTNAQEAQIN